MSLSCLPLYLSKEMVKKRKVDKKKNILHFVLLPLLAGILMSNCLLLEFS